MLIYIHLTSRKFSYRKRKKIITYKTNNIILYSLLLLPELKYIKRFCNNIILNNTIYTR